MTGHGNLFMTALFFLGLVVLLRSPMASAQSSGMMADAVRPFVDRHELVGAVMLAADKERVLTVEAVGWADIAAQEPMKTDSLFWIASQSKPITAAALMMLVDEGKVNVDDPVEKYLPEFHGQMVVAERDEEHVLLRRPKHPITVKNILSHTSGLPFSSLMEGPLDRFPLCARVRSYAMMPLDFEPDSKYQYSNAGINTAARIIEVITGTAFERFLAERLFQPLAMTDTTFWPSAEQITRLAKSYKASADKHKLEETVIDQLHYPLDDRKERFPMPAGGLFSTAHDIARFYQMLLNGGQLEGRRYLSESAVKALTNRETPDNVQESYGFGLQVGPGSFGHGGAYSTNTVANTEKGLILVWLVQHASFPGDGDKAQGVFMQAATSRFAAGE